jgi:hypothetical protein
MSSFISSEPDQTEILPPRSDVPGGKVGDAAERAASAATLPPPYPVTGRPPPRAARILIPVWGEQYIQQFINLSLPTLLAPGNIPAIAAQLPCEVEFLTSHTDAERLASTPAIRRLESICRVSLRTIDDLIVPGLHPLTITLAYARAIRALGAAACDTCCFLLVSDYVVADGSLGHVLSLMMAGKSAIQAGNFRMIDTDWPAPAALPYIDGVLPLPPRTLARMALAHLHPKTVANIVDFSLCRNDDCNQVFWRAGAETLIGKFFLLHPICVRPEHADFAVSGFVDYAFVADMAARENVATITDSDDYLVVELQAAEHESETLRLGPLTMRGLGRRLSEWTTTHHRRNADATIIYHAGELPRDLPNVVAVAEQFIDVLRQHLSPAAQPHRGHPYWYGVLARYETLVGRTPLDLTGPDLPPDVPSLGARGKLVLLRQRLRRRLIGQYPSVAMADPRWPDLRRLMECLADACAQRNRVILTCGAPPEINAWIAHRCHCHWVLDDGAQADWTGRLTRQSEAATTADEGLIYVGDGSTRALQSAMRTMVTALRPGGRLFILILNDRPGYVGEPLQGLPGSFLSDLESVAGQVEEIRLVPASDLRRWIARAMAPPRRDALSEVRRAGWPARIRAFALLALSAAVNTRTARRSGDQPSNRRPSSIFVVARPRTISAAHDTHDSPLHA